MCEPVSATTATVLAIAGTGASLFGAGMSAGGALENGKEAEKQALLNAALSQQLSVDALMRGRSEAGLLRARTSRDIAKRVVAAGASGAALSGSVVDAMEDARMWGEVDAQTVMSNAFREAWGYEVQRHQYEDAASVARKRGNAEAGSHLLNGLLGAVGTAAKLA
jgi:hypothetical protein